MVVRKEMVKDVAVGAAMVPRLLVRGLTRRASEWAIMIRQRQLRKLSLKRQQREESKSKKKNQFSACRCLFFKPTPVNDDDDEDDDDESYVEPFIDDPSLIEIKENHKNNTNGIPNCDQVSIEIHHHYNTLIRNSRINPSPVLSNRSFGSRSIHMYESPNELFHGNILQNNEDTKPSPIIKHFTLKSKHSFKEYQLPKDDLTHYSVVLDDTGYNMPVNSGIDNPYQIIPTVMDWDFDDNTCQKKKTTSIFGENSPFNTLKRLAQPIKFNKRKLKKKRKLIRHCCSYQTNASSTSSLSQLASDSECIHSVVIMVNCVNKCKNKGRRKKKIKSGVPGFIRFSPSSRTSCNYYLHERKSKILKGRNNLFFSPSLQLDVEKRSTEPIPSLSKSPKVKDITEEDYYFDITRSEAKAILSEACQGDFLIRPSKRSDDHKFTLSIQNGHSITNLPIRRRNDGTFSPGSQKAHGQVFDSIQDLIECYKRQPVLLANKTSCILGKTAKRPT